MFSTISAYNRCSVRLYPQLFVGGFKSYLRYLCQFGSSLPPVVCRRVQVLSTLFVFVRFVFTSSCLQEGSSVIYVICVCSVRLYLQLFVGGFKSYLCYLCLFGSSLPPVVCRRVQVLFTLFVFIRFVFTSFRLQEGSSLIYIICDCLRIVVFNKYCVVFLICLSSSCVLCIKCCLFLWIVHFLLPIRYSLTFIKFRVLCPLRLRHLFCMGFSF